MELPVGSGGIASMIKNSNYVDLIKSGLIQWVSHVKTYIFGNWLYFLEVR